MSNLHETERLVRGYADRMTVTGQHVADALVELAFAIAWENWSGQLCRAQPVESQRLLRRGGVRGGVIAAVARVVAVPAVPPVRCSANGR